MYGLTRSYLQKLILGGFVLVNGLAAKPSSKLKPNDNVLVTIPTPESLDLVPEPMLLNVLFEDEHLIVVNKPAGLVVHPGPGHAHGTLVHGLLAHCTDLAGIGGKQRPGIVHRLDRDTSGALVIAKHDLAHIRLVEAFKNRQIVKIYDGIVIGSPTPSSGCFDSPIERHRTDRKRFTSKTGYGKPAMTEYKTIKCSSGLTHLEFNLLTGRTHQIRVHASDAGYPLLGDTIYGRRSYSTQLEPLHSAISALTRQALHSRRLQFLHPISGAPLRCEAPLPPDFLPILAAI
jgi:23S rRNA pseudouridine1911/1915/1917 synthase